MKKWLMILIPIIILGIVIGIIIKENANEVKMNEQYVNGNTAGNLYNGGLFCESNGVIFFSNPSDNGRLYSMDSNGSNLTKLSNDVATFINADENYVYYVKNEIGGELDYSFSDFNTTALYRIDRNGENPVILDGEPTLYAALLGNYIYYLHYDQDADTSFLYQVRIDGEEQRKVMNEAVYTCNTDEQYFYYNGMSRNGYIHRFDTSTNNSTVIYEGNAFQPIVKDGVDVYYIDGDSNYTIAHTNLEFNNPRYITEDSVDAYNVHGSTIYYQRYAEGDSALCMVKNDGSENTVIKKGDYCDIHVTSYFVFFRDFHSGQMYYFLRSNPEDIQRFNPGIIKKY